MIVTRIHKAEYGSKDLLDSVEEAIDAGIPMRVIDSILDSKATTFTVPPATSRTRHWRAIAGPPDPRRAWWPGEENGCNRKQWKLSEMHFTQMPRLRTDRHLDRALMEVE
jgi:hypothetical protein